MTGFWPGAISFLVAIASGFSSGALLRLPLAVRRLLTRLALVVSLYCASLGVFHALVTWHFVDLTGLAAEAGVSSFGKRGVALALVSVWPIVMVAAGLGGAVIYWVALRKLSR